MGVLEDYAAKVAGKAKPEWRRPTMEDFQDDFRILSFDQSLGKTGWVYLRVVRLSGVLPVVQMMSKGTIRTTSELKSHEAYFDREDQLNAGLSSMEIPGRGIPDFVLLERPSILGKRIESSLLAASNIRRHSRRWWVNPQVASIQHSRTVLAGIEARDDKKAGHEALVEYLPESATRKWNEDERDGAINALAFLHDLKAAS